MLTTTGADKALTLPFTGRDPLGIQAIWQYRARDVVPALNAASRRADGFRVLATGLAWWPIFAGEHRRRATDQSKFFLLFEQAVARSFRTIGGKDEWRLPGKRGLNAGRPGVFVGLDRRQHYLLDSPLANGVWGIYRGPMIKAKLIDGDNYLQPKLAEMVRRKTPQVQDLFRRFAHALANPGEDTELAVRPQKQLVQDLAALVESTFLQQEIASWFVTGASDLCNELSLISRENEEAGSQWLVQQGIKRLPQHRETLTRVHRCERYLACVETIFEAFCSESGKTLANAATRIRVDLGALARAQAAFKDSGSYEGLARERHDELANAPLDSLPALGDYLLKHHATVSRRRRSSPWATVNEGRIITSELAVDAPDERQLDPRRAWRNSYYLDALKWLARDLAVGGRP